MKYRGRARSEARQWNGEKDPSWEQWMGKSFNGWSDDPQHLRFLRWNGDRNAALPGYWIIQYTENNFEALPPSTFEEHYEPCEEIPALAH